MNSTGLLLQLFTIGIVITAVVAGVAGGRRSNNGIFTFNRWYDFPGYSETPYSDCGSKGSNIQRVEVIPCDNDHACQLKAGSNATFKISFLSKVNTTSLKARIHGIVAGIPIPFHCPQDNACENSNIACPIVAGKVYHYAVDLPVLSSYPRVNVKVKWELMSAENMDVVCLLIPAKIVS